MLDTNLWFFFKKALTINEHFLENCLKPYEIVTLITTLTIFFLVPRNGKKAGILPKDLGYF